MLKNLRKKDIQLSPQAILMIQRVITAVILLCFIAGIALIYWNLLPPRKDFYNELWGPVYLLMRGQSPYNTASLDTELPAAWLPMSIGFFAPLGLMGEEPAQRFWFIFNLLELAVILAFFRSESKSIAGFIVAATMVFGFPSSFHHLVLGQFSLTTTLCILFGAYFIFKGRDWFGAFFLALGLSKIHLMTLPMLGFSIYYFQRSDIKGMFSFWGRVALASIVLCLPLFIAYPNWIPDAVKSMLSNEPWAFPTIQKYLVFNLGNTGLGIWFLSVILIIGVSVFIWNRFDPVSATYWSMGLALLISPYIGSWDFVVLLPLILHFFLPASIQQKIFIFISFVIAWILMARIQLLTESHNFFFWWVPLWFLAAMAIIVVWKIRSGSISDTRPA